MVLLGPSSGFNFEKELDIECIEYKSQIRDFILKYPNALLQIIKDIKDGTIEDKAVNLPDNSGQIVFSLKNGRVVVSHVKNKQIETDTTASPLLDDLYRELDEENKSPDSGNKSLVSRGFDQQVLDEINKGIEEEYIVDNQSSL